MSWRHGTQYAYRKKGCRCQPCKAAEAAAHRRSYERNTDKRKAYATKRRLANPQRHAEYAARSRAKNPEMYRTYNKAASRSLRRLAKRYPRVYEALLAEELALIRAESEVA